MKRVFGKWNLLFGLLLLAQWSLVAQSVNDLSRQAHQAMEQPTGYALAAQLFFDAAWATDEADDERFFSLLDSSIITYHLVTKQPSFPDSTIAYAFHRIGYLETIREDIEASIPAFRQAIKLRNKLYPNGHNDRAKSYFNLSWSLFELGRYGEAEEFLQESNRIYGSIDQPDTMRWLRVFDLMARNYRAQEDPQLTRSAVLRALPLVLSFYRNDADDLAFYYYEHSVNLSSIGQADLFREKMETAIILYQAAGDIGGEAKTRMGRAAAALEEYDYQAAFPDLKAAEDLLDKFGDEDGNQAYVQFNLADYYQYVANFPAAIIAGEKAVAGFLVQQDSLNLIGAYHGLANIYSKAGNRALADENFSNALQIMGYAEPLIDLKIVPADQLVELSELLDERAGHYHRFGQLEAAEKDYESVFHLQDRIRLELDSEESQVYISKRVKPVFQRAISLLYTRFQESKDAVYAERALVLAERSKAFSLLLAALNQRNDLPRREQDLNQEIVRLERLTDAKSIRQLADTRLELQRIQWNRNNKEAKELQLPAPLDVASLVSYLTDKKMSLIEFALGETHSYRFIINQSGQIDFVQLAGEDQLAKGIQDFRVAIRNSAYKSVSLKSDQAALDMVYKVAGSKLYNSLFGTAEIVEGWADRLLIVPDGVLGFLPFGALPTTNLPKPPLQYGELPYLARDRELLYSYSAAYLLQLKQQRSNLPKNNLLAFAPSFRGNADDTVKPQNRAVTVVTSGERSFAALAPLRHNREEVATVSSLFSRSKAFYDEEAKRAAFEQLAEQYRILLISSHAIVNSRDPNLSFIAFSQSGDSLEMEEMLYLNDLSTMNLPVELAVLSACETSMGKVAPGEGVLSLARAFARSGAASTLTTLWKVDDEATKQLSVDFFTALDNEERRSEALHNAQLKAMNSEVFAHPYYWSAMTLYGEGGKVHLAGGIPWIRIGIAAALFMVLIILFKRR